MIQTYPIILSPTNVLSAVPSAERNKHCKKSAIEIVALSCARELHLDEIYDNVRINIKGHNYEPDLVLYKSDKLVCIDIEIDEPYSVSGHPTHYLENGIFKDSQRNINFQESGWYVIRFSERQIFTQTKSCLKEVYKLAVASGAIDKLPEKFSQIQDLQSEPCWTKNESYDYKQNKYRTNYLGMEPGSFHFRYILQYLKIGIPILRQAVFNSRIRQEVWRGLIACFITKR